MESTDHPTTGDDQALQWRKSSLSGSSGCLEVARVGRFIHVRDSDDLARVVLVVSDHSWDCFLGGVRKGDFDGV